MEKLYIRTYAYNAEKTLSRAIDSVLNQKHTDFLYYICDNGSNDATYEIVEKYAKLDKRIRVFHNKVNRDHSETKECLYLPHHIAADDYYCTLDADDEYLPVFFEKMLTFMDQYNLDIASCGSDFICDDQKNQITSKRILPQNLILEGQDFEKYFPVYHVFLRTVWGKLYKGWTVRNTVQASDSPDFPRAYGGDTFDTLRAFSSAKRVGILAESLHKYYVSPKSVSYIFHPQRVRTDQILHKAALDYLRPFGEISQRNMDFLSVVYLNALKDTFRVILNAQIPISKKLNALFEMFTCEYTKQLAVRENFGMYIGDTENFERDRKEFFTDVANFLLTLDEVPDVLAEQYCVTGELASAAAEFAEGWVLFNKMHVHFLISQARVFESQKRLEELETLCPEDSQVLALREELNKIKNF